jgi:hypothetical protein
VFQFTHGAHEIREYYINVTQWKSHDSYPEELGKLLPHLKKAGSGRAATP